MNETRPLVAIALLASLLALAPGTARAGALVRLGEPFPPAVVVAPAPFYQPYYPPILYAPPAGIFESWWDPDYRAIRYNHYFQRYQEPGRIHGFTLH
jgi:hypothetical protein